jgi:hypothetical protein
MKYKYKPVLPFIVCLLIVSQSYAQKETRPLRLGLEYSFGKQQIFPYNSPNYIYNVKGYKTLINWPVKKAKAFSFELQLEPGIYFAKHRLLEETFVTPDGWPDYLEKRIRFLKEKTITESALNIGFLVRYSLKKRMSFFILGSIGPMYSDTETERLARGFAFSDIGALGCGYKTGKLLFEIRAGVRHVSNADLQFPNSGHNSSNIDFVVSYFL